MTQKNINQLHQMRRRFLCKLNFQAELINSQIVSLLFLKPREVPLSNHSYLPSTSPILSFQRNVLWLSHYLQVLFNLSFHYPYGLLLLPSSFKDLSLQLFSHWLPWMSVAIDTHPNPSYPIGLSKSHYSFIQQVFICQALFKVLVKQNQNPSPVGSLHIQQGRKEQSRQVRHLEDSKYYKEKHSRDESCNLKHGNI